MAARNSRKIFVPGKTYHVYNRGVDGRTIFVDDQDYRTYLYYLKIYLADPKNLKKEFPNVSFKYNLFGKVKLLSFCLMPNHFHLLVHQQTIDGMSKLLQRVSVAYSGYFNRKYGRSGTLFQGVYRAVPADTPNEILGVSRYINLNPIIEKIDDDFRIIPGRSLTEALEYPYSSLAYIVGKKRAEWLDQQMLLKKLEECLPYRNRNLSYLDFLRRSETGGRFVDV